MRTADLSRFSTAKLPLLALAVAVVISMAACSDSQLPIAGDDPPAPERSGDPDIAGDESEAASGDADPVGDGGDAAPGGDTEPDGAATDGGGSAPDAGNPDGNASVPTDARAEDTADPDTVIGNGTADSCTSEAVVDAVAQGGVVTFDCGPDPVTITMTETAQMTAANPSLVLDGGGNVTLSGGGDRRILEADVCVPMNEPRWCQSGPSLTLQNLRLVDADSSGGETVGGAEDGGGAVLAKGARVKVVNSSFSDNRCVPAGADPGGAALRLVMTPIGEPATVVHSTFEDGACSNGGAISGLFADLAVYNSRFVGNRAIGRGQNHPDPSGGQDGVGLDGQPGGGLGGAIYMDGQQLTLTVAGSVLEDNHANELGGAIFFVNNAEPSGVVSIDASTLQDNPATEQDRWGSTPGLYLQGLEGFDPGQPLTGDQLSGIVTDTTLE
ncbi:MAG TPA: hypothetical protein VK875_08965 [Euzebyales bacterium]|nr:hypothetical protein [Euzebyales bacterium]